MQCWKSININKHSDNQKKLLLSLLTMLLSFITLYPLLSLKIRENTLYDDNLLLFVCGVIFIYPLHKLLHLVPLFFFKRGLNIKMEYDSLIHPVVIKLIDPVSKRTFLFALTTPFIILTSVIIGCLFTFTEYAHYFTILLSIHIGLCVSDFITLKNILQCPSNSFIEENDEGIKILIETN